MAGTTTYSAVSTTAAFAHPLAGVFQIAGINQGVKQYVVAMATNRVTHDKASDGAIMITYEPGNNGTLSIECQQTSAVDQFLEDWANICFTAADGGDVTDVASATVLLRNSLNSHLLTGVSPTKIPDKSYAGQGGYRTWSLMAADIINL